MKLIAIGDNVTDCYMDEASIFRVMPSIPAVI